MSSEIKRQRCENLGQLIVALMELQAKLGSEAPVAMADCEPIVVTVDISGAVILTDRTGQEDLDAYE